MAATLEATQVPNTFSLADFLRQLFSHLGIILTLAAVLALGVGVTLWSIKPEYSPVYSNLSQADVGMVADVLRSSNIPFRMDSSSGMILVANDKIGEAKIILASEGLPQSNGTGYEVLNDKPSLGTSQFMETARYQHALETELSRTIAGMRNIDNSRVHIATPKQSVFIRNRGLTSASVMIKLMPGRVLESGQVSSITHLVASSVPYLDAANVTIVNQWGQLLSSTGTDDVIDQSNKQLAYKKSVEQTYANRIEELLAPIYGRNKIKAQVNAEIEFSKSESAEELYDPDNNQVRSEQISEQRNQGSSIAALGIPGALSNQPPSGGTLQTEESQEGEEGSSANSTPVSTSQNTTKNYELDKTMRYTQEAKSLVNRITVAIVVDDKDVINEAGETVKTPLASEDFALIRGIVRDAIGFNEERGDSVTVYNSSFLPQVVLEEPEATPIWKQSWLLSIIKQVFAGISVLIILFMFVRPAMKALMSKHNSATGGSSSASQPLLEGSSGEVAIAAAAAGNYPNYVQQLAMAKELVSQDPKQVAKIVKNWVAPSGE
ncbi:MAG: flagellar M-ring protein FliF [Gammaproteobacteria bacterium]|nr:MAG: flagellar M-ring protein FliF [Gammaproteobacteria bacterium]